jgi:hypothetical protein
VLDHTKYEIQCYKEWVEVTEYIFRSWTGARRIDGVDHTGPVYRLGTDWLYTGNARSVVA